MPQRQHHPRYGRRRALAAALLVLLAVGVVAGLGAAWRVVSDDGAGTGRPPAAAPGADDGGRAPASPEPTDPAGPTATPTPAPAPTPSDPPEVRVTLVAAGDVLPHQAVLDSARSAAGYDFGPLLAPLGPWVAGADLALCHLEVPVAPAGTAPSGYPTFGAPPELAAALADQGWDGCSTASNHAFDRGPDGVVTTLDTFDAAGLGHVGTARTPAEAVAPQLYRLERGGRTLTVAHLAATYDVNGPWPPADAPWSVTLLDAADLAGRAAAARAAGADVVVVSVHCCVEYVAAPHERQAAVARELAASGAVDLVVGHHAHVPQPVERLPGGPGGAGMWVLHGLGNLLSNQDAQCCVPQTATGVLATAEVVAPAGAPARVVAVSWTGTTVDRGAGHRVHALRDVPAGTATLSAAEVAARTQLVATAVGPSAPERTEPPDPTGPAPVVVPRPR